MSGSVKTATKPLPNEEVLLWNVSMVATQPPHYSSAAVSWLVRGLATAAVLCMPLGPMGFVCGGVLGGLLTVAFGLLADAVRYRSRRQEAKQQKRRLEDLIRWTAFVFSETDNSVTVLYYVIRELEPIVLFGGQNRTAAAIAKRFRSFLERLDVQDSCMEYVDEFVRNWKNWALRDIATFQMVCEVCTRIFKQGDRWPPVYNQMREILCRPMMQHIFSQAALERASLQRQARKDNEWMALADIGEDVRVDTLFRREWTRRFGGLFGGKRRRSQWTDDEDRRQPGGPSSFTNVEDISPRREDFAIRARVETLKSASTEFLTLDGESPRDDFLRRPSSHSVIGRGQSWSVSVPDKPPDVFLPVETRSEFETSNEPFSIPVGQVSRSSTKGAEPPASAPETVQSPAMSSTVSVDEIIARTSTPKHSPPLSKLPSSVSLEAPNRTAERRSESRKQTISDKHTITPDRTISESRQSSRDGRRKSQDSRPRSQVQPVVSLIVEDTKEALEEVETREEPTQPQATFEEKRFFKDLDDLCNFNGEFKRKLPIALYEFEFLDEMEPEEPKGDWECVSNKPTMRIYKRISSVGGSDLVMVKAYAELDGITPEVILYNIRDTNRRKQWDTTFSGFALVETGVHGNEMVYNQIPAPWPVMSRDFLQWRRTVVDESTGVIRIFHRSAEHPKMKPTNQFIRAESIISAYVIRPKVDSKGVKGSRLFLLTQTDVKGSIPRFLVNATAAKAPNGWIENLKKACLETQNKPIPEYVPQPLYKSGDDLVTRGLKL